MYVERTSLSSLKEPETMETKGRKGIEMQNPRPIARGFLREKVAGPPRRRGSRAKTKAR